MLNKQEFIDRYISVPLNDEQMDKLYQNYVLMYHDTQADTEIEYWKDEYQKLNNIYESAIELEFRKGYQKGFEEGHTIGLGRGLNYEESAFEE